MSSCPVNLLFGGKNHAKVYSLYRPSPPDELIQEMVKYIREGYDGSLDTAIDVGCGSGQCTILLAKLFKQVIGMDISEAQIDEAIKSRSADNIEYRVQPAEVLPVGDVSVQLVNATTCIHYFEHEAFFAEVQRVLVPGGVLVASCHKFVMPLVSDDRKNKEIEAVVDRLYTDLKEFWSPKSKFAFEDYRDIEFPFDDVRRIHGIRDAFPGKMPDLIGYMETLSGYQCFMKKHGEEEAKRFLQNIRTRLCEILELRPEEEETTELTLYRDYFAIFCRKKAETI